MTSIRFPVETVRRQTAAILGAWGMAPETVEPTVAVMTETDQRGIDSHGIAMLPLYGELRRQGKIEMRPRIEVVRDAGVTGLIDGGGGLGHAPSTQAMRLAIAKAREMGMAAVAVRNSNHFGAAGAYALMAARAGLIGMAMTNAGSRVIVPTRAKEAVFGTNPIAFAAPAGRQRPFVLDMATSTVAVGKIKLAVYNGKPLPGGWVVDPEGRTVTDPKQPFDGHGRIRPGFGVTPLGGLPMLSSHKGYGLAAMVEILCSMLPGTPFIGAVDRAEHQTGHFFLALDPAAFRDPDDYAHELDAMIEHLHGLSPMDPEAPVLVAGDPEDAAEAERREQGVPVPALLRKALQVLCEEAGAEFLMAD
ncbi:MAG TPA: Ldh family oxidoreductase [Alphaproteobacteria bacterium]|nr:Ldh family oxidoreductase [Alphaproteobacteria bacterium]